MATKTPRENVGRELEFHLEMLVRRYEDDGLSPADARAKAEARIGDLDTARRRAEAIHHADAEAGHRSGRFASIVRDMSYALRVLRRAPLFTATALLTIAVGTGATTAIFSVVNTVLLRPLPYANATRVMYVFNAYGQAGEDKTATAPPEFADIRSQSHAFDALAALRPQDSSLTDGCASGAGCEPERISTYGVSPELFQMLGASPIRGRDFVKADGVDGAARVILISHGLWQRRFGAATDIVGRAVTVGGISRTVIGVMPENVQFPDDPIGYLKARADVWIPVNWENRVDQRGNQYLLMLALRKPTVSAAAASADLAVIADSFKARFPSRYAEPQVHWRIGATSLREEMVGDVRTALLVLFGAVACVLMIACANVANLMMARGSSRMREMAVRAALGASRPQIVQQLLVETLVLTGAGTVLGVGVAWMSLRVLIAINPGNIPRISTATIDLQVLAFATVLAVATGVVVGLWPALRQARSDPQRALAGGTRSGNSGGASRSLRGLLVAAEVTMAVVVLVGALLLIRSFMAMSHAPTGFSLNGTVVAEITIPRAAYDTPAKIHQFDTELAAKLGALPGSIVASAVYPLPLSGDGWSGSVSVVGVPEGPGDPGPHAEYAVALPKYFAATGIPILEGRDFNDADSDTSESVAIVDAEFARKYFPGRSAVGQRISTSGNLVKGPFETVIGVVGHTHRDGARENGEAQLYLPALQHRETTMYFVTRASGAASTLVSAVRSIVRGQDAKQPVTRVLSGDDLMRDFTARDRFNVLLFTIFGGMALVLSAVGMYGVLASIVAQRTREIGIRIALGGKPASVARGLVGEGMRLAGVGLFVGLVLAAWLSRALTTLLFGIGATDAVTYAVVAGMVLLVSFASSAVPAVRAMRINPVETLSR